jgi:hypothetical protein
VVHNIIKGLLLPYGGGLPNLTIEVSLGVALQELGGRL